jgi:hypothetical protein
MKRHLEHKGRILLKNSVFGQLGAFHRKIIPLAHHSENVVCQRRAHKTLVLISGSVFPAGEFFNSAQTFIIAQILYYKDSNLRPALYFPVFPHCAPAAVQHC